MRGRHHHRLAVDVEVAGVVEHRAELDRLALREAASGASARDPRPRRLAARKSRREMRHVSLLLRWMKRRMATNDASPASDLGRLCFAVCCARGRASALGQRRREKS